MTIRGQHRNRYLYSYVVLVFMILFATPLTGAEKSVDQSRTFRFEIRLASHEKVEGWEKVPGPAPAKAFIWVSPEAALTNVDVARAWPQPNDDGFDVGFQLTEEGALKLARLTKSHVGEFVAILIDDRVVSAPKIMAEITGGRALLAGNFTEEEAKSTAEGIVVVK